MRRTTTAVGVAAAVLALLGPAAAHAAEADCASLGDRVATAEPGSPAQFRLADQRATACASGATVETLPATERVAVVTAEANNERIAHLDRLLAGATKGSPAHFRLVEERDRR